MTDCATQSLKETLTDDQQDLVLAALAAGFGVEDIAVDLECPAGVVRAFVRSLSPDLIREIYQRGAA